MRYATVLFDVGETLLHVPEPAPEYRQLLARCGHALPIEEVEAILREVRRTVDERIPRWLGDDLTLDYDASTRRRAMHVDTFLALAGLESCTEIRDTFFDFYVGTDFFTLYPDVPETLEQLRSAGCKLGIVSNWESRLPALCSAHGIAHYFDFTVISEVEGFVKPHPHMYRRALERAGVPPERVAHVGDSLRDDIEGAAALGIWGILVDRAGTTAGAYEPRISSLTELPRVLDAAG